MFTGFKRVPRNVDKSTTEGYQHFAEEVIPPKLLSVERWFNYRHPALGSILLVVAVVLVVLEITQILTHLNKYMMAY
jgi:hypothetical protein